MKLCLPFSVLKTMRCTSRGRRCNSIGHVGFIWFSKWVLSGWTRDLWLWSSVQDSQAVTDQKKAKAKMQAGPPELPAPAVGYAVSLQLRVRKAGDQKKQPAYHQVEYPASASVFFSSRGWRLK